MHLWSFCSRCKSKHNMLTLQESVPISTGTSSSDVLGICFIFDYMSMDMCQACEWNSQQLAEWITHVPLFWLTARGYCLTPLFSVLSWWSELPIFLNEEILRVLYAHLILFNLTPQMFGYAWVLKARSRTQALLGWAIALGWSDWGSLLLPTQGSLSTLLNPSGTALESTTLEVS